MKGKIQNLEDISCDTLEGKYLFAAVLIAVGKEDKHPSDILNEIHQMQELLGEIAESGMTEEQFQQILKSNEGN